MRFTGTLYRALNPLWAHQPLSGEGAKTFGGRFNPRGTPALYLSTSILTAVREANQVGTLQPTTLISYQADLDPVFDATDAHERSRLDITLHDLSDDSWRDQMRRAGTARTQLLALNLIGAGYVGMRVPSFAAGAAGEGVNLVLWNWIDTQGPRLVVVDDEGRLPRAPGTSMPTAPTA